MHLDDRTPTRPQGADHPSPFRPLRSWATSLRHDLPASLVVFLVAVPLSLGIAVASEAPLSAGLIAAAIGGIVAGALGGSPLTVSGPAAGLTVIVADLVTRFGWGVTCLITAAAGVVQVGLGLSRAGRAALAISPAVVHGMLAGIGVTIVVGQLHVVLGGEQQDGGPLANIAALPAQLVEVEGPATALGLATIALLLLWPQLTGRAPRWLSGVPAPLLAVVAVTAVASVLMLSVERVDVGGSVLDAVALPVLPTSEWGGVIVGVFTIAIIASIESLLSAVAVDRMPGPGPARPQSNLDRELIGQGAGNAVSGLLGGLPITGVIVRSTANVAAGARSRGSAILHGVWIVVFSVALLGLVEQIPMAVLAGLLVVIGARLVKIAHMRELAHHGELPVYVVTLVGVVATDLLTGVLIGLGLALALVLRRVVWASIDVQAPAAHDAEGAAWHVVVEGALSFLSIPRLSRALAEVPEGADTVIDLVTDYLDHAAYEHLSEWVTRRRGSGAQVRVDEVGTMGLGDRAADAVSRSRIGGPGDRRPGMMPRFFSPWSTWQTRQRQGDDEQGQQTQADPMLVGLQEYHRRTAGLVAPHLSDLAEGQTPHALFLTCADSRVVPNVITSSGPGDLFTVRNIGNLAPTGPIGRSSAGSEEPREPGGDGGVAAAVEYALGVLGVSTIVVCGHSGCAAMTTVLSGPTPRGALGRWLVGAEASLTAWRRSHPVGVSAREAGVSEIDQLAMVNVAVQLERLARHPAVASTESRRPVNLVGLYFDIATARMSVLDDDRFVPASTDRLGAGAPGSAEPAPAAPLTVPPLRT